MHLRHSSIALTCAVALTSMACAEFVIGNEVYIQGISGPQDGYTYWQGFHDLGDLAQPFQNGTFPTQIVTVSSWVNSATSVTFSFDFSGYDPGYYTLHALEIFNLKNDGSLSSVTSSQGFAYVQDGIKIRWDGLGADLALAPKLVLTIEQVPAPAALSLLGVAAVAATRRRRA